MDPIADFLASKQYTIQGLEDRVHELELDDAAREKLTRLKRYQLETLREDLEGCMAAFEEIGEDFIRACADIENELEDDEDEEENAPRSPINPESRASRMDEESWGLLAAYAPKRSVIRKNSVASCRAAELISARPKACWFNARRLIEVVDEYADAVLVEGYAVDKKGRVIEHGWVVAGGEIIDPTIPDQEWEYFPGLEFEGRRAIAEFNEKSLGDNRRQREDAFFCAFGWGGQDSPHMKSASDRANQRSRQICGT